MSTLTQKEWDEKWAQPYGFYRCRMCGDLARPTWRDIEELKPDPDNLAQPLYAVLLPRENDSARVELARPRWELDQRKGQKYIVWEKRDGGRVWPSHWMMLPDLEDTGYGVAS